MSPSPMAPTSFLSALPPTTPDFSVFLPDSGVTNSRFGNDLPEDLIRGPPLWIGRALGSTRFRARGNSRSNHLFPGTRGNATVLPESQLTIC